MSRLHQPPQTAPPSIPHLAANLAATLDLIRRRPIVPRPVSLMQSSPSSAQSTPHLFNPSSSRTISPASIHASTVAASP
ncbi:hypothetical protein M0R45_008619 [Rubus argutus]|uniref:Uncharacterized protein n=1 Tax=Rubus argutus TaxID=59490 RepID=A0AAW1Y3E0_RUBAR